MSLINSPWLSDWRQYADQTQMSDQDKRTIQAAIRQTEQSWVQRHAETYRAKAELRFAARDEKVVGACDQMRAQLREIRAQVEQGRLSPDEARGKVRDIRARVGRVMETHDSILAQEDEVKAFAEMTPDDFQRDFVGRFPALQQTAPTLAGVVERMTPPPPPGGSLGPNSSFVPTRDAPSADDLR